MELDELEIDPSMFEPNTVESYFNISSRYKSELKAKINWISWWNYNKFKEIYYLLDKNIRDETTRCRFVSNANDVKPHAYWSRSAHIKLQFFLFWPGNT